MRNAGAAPWCTSPLGKAARVACVVAGVVADDHFDTTDAVWGETQDRSNSGLNSVRSKSGLDSVRSNSGLNSVRSTLFDHYPYHYLTTARPTLFDHYSISGQNTKVVKH